MQVNDMLLGKQFFKNLESVPPWECSLMTRIWARSGESPVYLKSGFFFSCPDPRHRQYLLIIPDEKKHQSVPHYPCVSSGSPGGGAPGQDQRPQKVVPECEDVFLEARVSQDTWHRVSRDIRCLVSWGHSLSYSPSLPVHMWNLTFVYFQPAFISSFLIVQISDVKFLKWKSPQ